MNANNKIAGSLLDSRGKLAMIFINKGDREQFMAAGVHSKYNQTIIKNFH